MKRTASMMLYSSIILLVLFLTACHTDKEITLSVDDIPGKILTDMNRSYPGAEVEEYSKEYEDGSWSYEIEFMFEGQEHEVKYSLDGTLIESERATTIEALPATVTRLLNSDYKSYSVEKIEEITQNGKIFYEVELIKSDGKGGLELVFSPDGQLISSEIEDGDED